MSPLKGIVLRIQFLVEHLKSNGPRINTDRHGSGELLFPHHARQRSALPWKQELAFTT